jgi:hypothetical protein
MKYKINWSKDAGEEFIEILSWYKYNAGKNIDQKIKRHRKYSPKQPPKSKVFLSPNYSTQALEIVRESGLPSMPPEICPKLQETLSQEAESGLRLPTASNKLHPRKKYKNLYNRPLLSGLTSCPKFRSNFENLCHNDTGNMDILVQLFRFQ